MTPSPGAWLFVKRVRSVFALRIAVGVLRPIIVARTRWGTPPGHVRHGFAAEPLLLFRPVTKSGIAGTLFAV